MATAEIWNEPPARGEPDALTGQGLLQSRAEWARRNAVLVNTLSQLIKDHNTRHTGRALDVGCKFGDLTDMFARETNYNFWGIDPELKQREYSPQGCELLPGYAHSIAFPDRYFDCIVFANVYEHIDPHLRLASLREMRRVLLPQGIIVGQIPNPYFPIESHSRLPFLGYLPRRAQRVYWKLSPTPWDFEWSHFYSVTIQNLKRVAREAGFETRLARNFNYPLDIIPQSVRWAARLLHMPMQHIMPWAWQFVLVRT